MLQSRCLYQGWYRSWLRRLTVLLFAPFALWCLAAAAESEGIDTADSRYQAFVEQFFPPYLQKHPQPSFEDVAALATAVTEADAVNALALVRGNLALLLRNGTKRETVPLLERLFDLNDGPTLQVIAEGLKNAGDPVALSRYYFLLAKYHERRGNWRAVKTALGTVNPRLLSAADAHYYQLLGGYVAQGLKDHRGAIKHYKTIPEGSPYFAHARLNEGTALLRQGWWTEAHMEFEKAIRATTDAEFRNRTLTVLGYSQLNYEFYKDARNSFRKVALDSASTNKALMGIGLAAAYQSDFTGAANAFALLTEKSPADLSVDEAFLLLPLAWAELGDEDAASVAYQVAIRHYENKMQNLKKLQSQLADKNYDDLLTAVNELDQRAAEIYGSLDGVPAFLLANYQNLLLMRGHSSALGLAQPFANVYADYKNLLQRVVEQKIERRWEILNHYLSQAKFGVAQLYDK